jgi:phosphoribosyl-ATP pyrophosphohydrolase/phosphoribosyl-AMP cyclohydrolase
MKNEIVSPGDLNFEKLNGLIPAVVVDNNSNAVLMLGFMNKESLQKTIDSGLVTFFSRSRQSLWTKGETSGNFLHVVDIKIDCDNDSLLLKVNPDGNTCHTGDYSCFKEERYPGISFLTELFKIVQSRKETLLENSYTSRLFEEGENRIIQKVGEEAIETIIAAKNNDRYELINETSDLIFHLFVLLAEKKITFKEISDNLQERHNK